MQIPVGSLFKASDVMRRTWSQRRGALPLRASAAYNPYYDTSVAFVAAVSDVHERPGFAERQLGLPGPDGSALVVQHGSPIRFVVGVTNTSNGPHAFPVYVDELVVRVVRLGRDEEYLAERDGLRISTVMAGGRGSEGGFDARVDVKGKIAVPLFAQASATARRPPDKLRVDPGRWAEISVGLWPENPGAYLIASSVGARSPWQRRLLPVADRLVGVSLTETTAWPRRALSDGIAGRAEMSIEEFRGALVQKWAVWESTAPGPLVAGRRALVSGGCNHEAY